MPKKNRLDQWAKQSLADHLHRAWIEVFTLSQDFNRYFKKTDDYYEEVSDLQRRLRALQKNASKDLELPKPTPPPKKM